MKDNVLKRNSSLELLRIICIFLIILHHYSIHGEWGDFTYNNLSANVVFVQLLQIGGKMACNIFLIITGYFMVKSKVNYKKIILLILEMIFYSILITLVFCGIGVIKIDFKILLKSIFPFFWGNWFIIYYIILYLLIPFLNSLIERLDKKTFKKMIILLFVIYSIIPTFTNRAWYFSPIDNFLVMYFIGAYIRVYNIEFKKKYNNYIGIILNLGMLILSVIFIDILGYFLKLDILIKNACYFGSEYSFLSIIGAIFIFILFKNIHIESKIINWIASSTLGIYLIHDNEIVRDYFWNIFYPNKMYLNDNIFIHAILKCLLIFIICLLIDKIRILIFERNIKKYIDKKYEKVAIKCKKIYNKYVNI